MPKASRLSLIVFRHPSSFPDTCPQAQNKQANPSVIIGITMARDPYLTWNLGMHDHSHELGRKSGAELPSMEGDCVLERNSLVVILRIRHSPTFGSYEYSADPPRSPSPQPMQQRSTLTRTTIAWNRGYPLVRLILLLGPGSTLPLSLSGHGEVD